MSFQTDMQDDFRELMLDTDTLAESITYTPISTEVGVSIDAAVNRGHYDQEFTDDGEYLVKTATVTISSDDSDGVSAPNVSGDTVTFDGLVWAVNAWEPSNMGFIRLTVVRRELLKKRVRR